MVGWPLVRAVRLALVAHFVYKRLMDIATFDSLAYAKRLAAHGFTAEQAEILAEEQTNLINSQLATKHDIALVQHDIALVRKDMKAMEASIRSDMKAMEMRTDTKIELLKRDLTIRLGGMMMTGVIAVAALIKFL